MMVPNTLHESVTLYLPDNTAQFKNYKNEHFVVNYSIVALFRLRVISMSKEKPISLPPGVHKITH